MSRALDKLSRQWKRLPFHPLANAFPMMDATEHAALKAGMKRDGFRGEHPVVLFEGGVLDGRNRITVARALGIKPTFRLFDVRREGAPRDFVIAENIDRRHLDASQRAMAMAELETLAHGDRPKDGAATRRDLARAGKVSERTIARAARVRDQGAPELQAAVKAGDLAVSAAAEIAAAMTKGDQAALIAVAKRDKLGEAAILQAAKQIRQEKSIKRREERARRIIVNSDCTAEAMLAGGRKYPIIYADPAWRYQMGDTDRSVENHYKTMSLEEICALPVRELALSDAVLFLWIPEPHLFCSGVPVLNAWGFEHKTGFIWDKVIPGMGKYSMVVHEHLLVATRGAPGVPAENARPRSLFSIKKSRKHSEKPNAHVMAMIERMYPQFFRQGGDPLAIELFAREARPGWARWGNQAPAAKEAA